MDKANTSGFSRAIYEAVEKIPSGKVTTYGLLARAAGRPMAARMAGWAMARAPEGLACHRVVNAAGDMAPGNVFGGAEKQRAVLKAEGVAFLPCGRVDFKKSLWDGP